MTFRFVVDPKQLSSISRRLNKLESDIRGRVITKSVGQSAEQVKSNILRRAKREKGPDDKKWKPFGKGYTHRPSDKTVKPPEIIIGPRGTPGMRPVTSTSKLLWNTGKMLGSLTWSMRTPQAAMIGSWSSDEAKKLEKHHFGKKGKVKYVIHPKSRQKALSKPYTVIKDLKPQARKVLGFSKTDRAEIMKIYRFNIRKALRGEPI